jgi:hypothetical protein
MRPQRRVWKVATQRVVFVAGGPADPDLHRPRRPSEVRHPGTRRTRLRRARRIRIATLIALLLADPGKDLPRELVLSPDLLVDREHPRWNVAHRCRRGRIADATARAALTDHDREHRCAAREQ